jgi:hypothetical protein
VGRRSAKYFRIPAAASTGNLGAKLDSRIGGVPRMRDMVCEIRSGAVGGDIIPPGVQFLLPS